MADAIAVRLSQLSRRSDKDQPGHMDQTTYPRHDCHAAVVTPIGLYEDLLPSNDPQLVTFMAVDDTGSMGTGTPPRSDLGFSRACGSPALMQCPATNIVINVSSDAFRNTTIEGGLPYDHRIPRVLAKLYQSGLQDQPSSVSSFFDIQARQYHFGTEQGEVSNDTYLVDSFKPVSALSHSNYMCLVTVRQNPTALINMLCRNHDANLMTP